MIKNVKRNWNVVLKLTYRIWRILTWALESLKIRILMGCFWLKYKIFGLKSTEKLCLMVLKIDAKFEGKLTCAFKNDITNWENFYRPKNSDFILEINMAELNQNKKSKQPDQSDTIWKLYFTFKINE